MARKLVKLSIKETSGVDHPAHLHDGWVVMKSATPADAEAVLDELRPTEVSDEVAPVEEVTELPAEEIEADEISLDTAKAANAVWKPSKFSRRKLCLKFQR